MSRAEALGVWISQGNSQELLWIINAEFITDRALRSWIYHNNPDGYRQHVGPCILQMHVDQYASRDFLTPKKPCHD